MTRLGLISALCAVLSLLSSPVAAGSCPAGYYSCGGDLCCPTSEDGS